MDTQGTPPGSLVADFLADQGKQVEIVTGLTYVGSGTHAQAAWHYLYGRLLEKGVVMTSMTGVSPGLGRTRWMSTTWSTRTSPGPSNRWTRW